MSDCRHEYRPVQIDIGERIPGHWVCIHCGEDAPRDIADRLEKECLGCA